MIHVMALAYLGRVRTLDDVALHRSVGGSTVDLATVHANLGLRRLEAVVPHSP